MSTEPANDRSAISFGQAEGVEPLPSQMQPRTMSQQLRAKLWQAIHAYFASYTARTYPYHLTGDARTIMLQWHVNVLHRFSDEFRPDSATQIKIAKEIISKGSYVDVFNFVEFVCRGAHGYVKLALVINHHLEMCRSPYRMVNNSIVPITSEAEIETVGLAFSKLQNGKFPGSLAHLINAGRFLTQGNWADSIRESIHAVESIATTVEPSAKTLGAALVRLEKARTLNPNLKRAFNALYDFTSDEKGIRHALLDEPEASVGEDEALYMYGACASFVTYLIRKSEHRSF